MAQGKTATHMITVQQQWFTLLGTGTAWLFVALTASIYAFVIPSIVIDFHTTLTDAASVVSSFLIATVVGGIMLGNLSDRYGRKNSLLLAIAIFGIFNYLCGSAQNLTQMNIYRFMVGIATGGLWAPAAALVSETWEAKNRGKAMGVMQTGFAGGSLLAAILAMAYLPTLGWRNLFYVSSIPAVFSFFVVLFFVNESPLWLQSQDVKKQREQGIQEKSQKLELLECFRGKNLKVTILGLSVSICGMFGYWVLFSFLPTYLDTVLKLNIGKSAVFLIWTGIGAVFGYLAFGYLCDKYGRRSMFFLFFLVMAVMVPVFTYSTENYGTTYLIPLSIVLGFFTGYFSGYGAWYSELFGTSIRATAAGLCYNGGRAAIFIAPPLVAKYLIPTFGFTIGINCVSIAFLLAAVLVYTLQETKGTELSAED